MQCARHEVFTGCQQQVVAGNCEGDFFLRLRIAAQIEVNSACAARLERRAGLPERRLHGFGRWQVSDIEELQVADVIQRKNTARSGNLGKEVHVGWKSGRSGELTAGAVETQEEAGAGEDFVVAAFGPLLLLRRGVPVREQAGEILGLEVEQRASRNVL